MNVNITYKFPYTENVGFGSNYTKTKTVTASVGSKLSLPKSTEINIENQLADDCNYGTGTWCYYSETQKTTKCETIDLADLQKNQDKTLYYSVATSSDECTSFNSNETYAQWSKTGCIIEGDSQGLDTWCDGF